MWVVTFVMIGIFLGAVGASPAQQEAEPASGTQLDPSIVEHIEKLGGTVRRIAQNEDALEVSFYLGRNQDGLHLFEAPKAGTPKALALDHELGVLKKLPEVVWLHLGGTDVTDEGLSQLSSLSSLTRLQLQKTRVSDSGLAHLKNLENLAYLNLYQTSVTDEGLSHLESLKKLKKLYLWQTKVTSRGAKKLQQVLPGCKINLGSETLGEPTGSSGSQEGP